MAAIARACAFPTSAIWSALTCSGGPWGKRLDGVLDSRVRRCIGRVFGDQLIPPPWTEVSGCSSMLQWVERVRVIGLDERMGCSVP